MKKLMKRLSFALVMIVLIAGVSFAKEIRENKSFREEYRQAGRLFNPGREKTVVRIIVHERNMLESIDYREYYDNCWWSGELRRVSARFDHSNNWWSVTFKGTLKKTDCFKTLALNEKGKEFGEIIDTGSFVPVEKEAEKRSDKSKRREVRIRLTKVKKTPANYYYEEYDDKKECYYGGELKLSRTYEEEGKTIACYRGYLEETE